MLVQAGAHSSPYGIEGWEEWERRPDLQAVGVQCRCQALGASLVGEEQLGDDATEIGKGDGDTQEQGEGGDQVDLCHTSGCRAGMKVFREEASAWTLVAPQ